MAAGLAAEGFAARVVAGFAAAGLVVFGAGLSAADLAAEAAAVARGLAAGFAAVPPLAAEAAVEGLARVTAGLAAAVLAGFGAATVTGLAAGFGWAAAFGAGVFAGFVLAALDFGAAFGLEAAVTAFGLDGALAMMSPTPEKMNGPAGPSRIAMIAVICL